MDGESETNIRTIVESDDNFAYIAEEPDGELTYHLQLNNVTLHFFTEEWQNAIQFLEKVIDAYKDAAE